jgi:spore coat protein U-like protein
MINSTSIRVAVGTAVGAVFFAAATPAAAQSASATATMNVQANVTQTCSLSASGINFGTVDTLTGAATNANGSITVHCTAGTNWVTYADNGEGPNTTRVDTAAGREMQIAGGDPAIPTLHYNLYRDAAYTLQYGNPVDGGEEINNIGDPASQKQGLPVTKTVYGRVFGGQHTVPAGNFSDRVVISLFIV